MSETQISSERELRSILKPPPGTVTAKIGSGPLLAAPSEFLAAARLGMVVSTDADEAPQMSLCGGAAGFVVSDPANGALLVPTSGPAGAAQRMAGQGFAGVLLMVPGVRYTLRVNGIASLHDDPGQGGEEVVAVAPDETYAHCAKAFIRSHLWDNPGTGTSGEAGPVASEPSDQLDHECTSFVARSPFAAVGTSLVDGEADVSPRGDPAGFVQVIDPHTLFVPERPGNRIADTLRNIIARPMASLLFLVPGDHRGLEVVGDAHVTTDETLCRSAEVNGKVPKLGVVLKVRSAHLRAEPALEAAQAWSPASHVSEADLPTIGDLVANPNGATSMTARLKSGATERAVSLDYRLNLY